jgi:hypothetical protein
MVINTNRQSKSNPLYNPPARATMSSARTMSEFQSAKLEAERELREYDNMLAQEKLSSEVRAGVIRRAPERTFTLVKVHNLF